MSCNWIVSVVVLLAAVAACCMAEAASPLPVGAMTFNIRMNTPSDGPNQWAQRREMAVELIRRSKADFVGVQEALPNQMADLKAMLPEYRLIGRSREADPKRGEATPVLYRHRRWQLDAEQHGTFWLSDTPKVAGSITWGNACTRIVTWGRFVDIENHRAIYVYNTHFDHISESARQKSAVLLAKHIAERAQTEPIVVTGDFNSGEASAAVTYLTGKASGSPIKLVDTFRVLHPDEKQVGTFHGFKGTIDVTKIDYIFVRPEAKVLSAQILHDHRDGRYPSDHFPVTAKFEYPAANFGP